MTYRFQAEIKAEHIRALAHLAAQEDVRFYLNGVQIVAQPEVLLVATTGAVIGALRSGQTASCPFEVLIPNATIKHMGKTKGPVLIGSNDAKDWVLRSGPMTLLWAAQEGVFPLWHGAIPDRVNGEAACFDERQVALFRKAAKDLGAETFGQHSVMVGQNGQGTALVSLPGAPDFAGAIIPLRLGGKFPPPPDSAPAWAKTDPAIPKNWRDAPAKEPCDLA